MSDIERVYEATTGRWRSTRRIAKVVDLSQNATRELLVEMEITQKPRLERKGDFWERWRRLGPSRQGRR